MSPESPIDATGIARRQFATSRKGFDPAEVRAYLHEVADLVGRLQRSESHERERAERAESRAQLAENLDQHRLVELLGEETARVLEAAREAAADIRAKAEESAARMVREAQAEARAITEQADKDAAARRLEILAEADGLRREAEAEVERRRHEGQVLVEEMRRQAEQQRDRMLSEGEIARAEAEAAAEQIRAAAREQGRRLVGEAQAVRERMLGDLSRRRRVAREQLERLNGARERLLAAYEVVKRTVDEATTELTVALPEARAASEQAMRRVSDEPEESIEVIEAELSVARMSGQAGDVAGAIVSEEEFDDLLRELAEEEAAQAAAARAGMRGGEPVADEQVDDEAGDDEPAAPADGAADPSGGAVAPEGDSAAPSGEPAPAGGATAGAGEAPVVGGGDTAGAGSRGPGVAPAASRPAERPAARPMTDGEKWGIRLPRPRPGREPVEAAPSARAPADVAASGAETGDAPADPDEGETGPYVDELFARIRSERGSDTPSPATAADPAASGEGGNVAVAVLADDPTVADTDEPAAVRGIVPAVAEAPAAPDAEAAEDATDDEDEPLDPVTRLLRERDAALATTERELGRRLKRLLADEQNEVLDTLRRGGTVEFADVVPPADEHAEAFADVAAPHLEAAAARGAALVGAEAAPACDELALELGHELVDQLRVRIEHTFDEGDGDLDDITESLRALYREWKGNHIGNAVRHYSVAAYGRGVLAGTPEGATLRWLVDPSCEACPDCDDNALAGDVVKGEAYPTGDTGAPAHPDCRCLVVSASVLDAG